MVNDVKVRNVKQVKEEVDKVKDGFITFKMTGGKSFILDAAQCRQVSVRAAGI